jgi:peptidoglycan hydrolase-like protein with peptidoglycan-binding domain
MGSAADALNVFRSFLGISESPSKSNHTPIGAEFGWNGVAWCDETVSVVLRRIGLAPGGGGDFASCSFHQQAYRNGSCGAWLGKPSIDQIRPGDQVFFGSSGSDHTGMVESVGRGVVVTLEGNIGDAVRRETRPYDGGSMRIFGFGRPNYDQAVAPGLPPPSATAGRAILRLGSKGEAVKGWQFLMHVTVDGDFGPDTDAATRRFQAGAGIAQDGEVGPQTWAAMDRALAYLAASQAPAPPPTAPHGVPDFPGTTRLGSHGDAVTHVQYVLRSRGWTLEVDGVFGQETDRIVREYQQQKGLAVDGVVGPVTWVSMCTAPIT